MGMNVTDTKFTPQMLENSSKINSPGMLKSSDLFTSAGQAELRAAGIDVNNPVCKSALKALRGSSGYINIQDIKNKIEAIKDEKDPDTKNSTEETKETDKLTLRPGIRKNQKDKIAVPDSIREEMFETVKQDFINGKWDDDLFDIKKEHSGIYKKLHNMIEDEDQAGANRSLREYEKQYIKKFAKIMKNVEPNRDPGTEASSYAIEKMNEIEREEIDKKIIESNNLGTNVDVLV